MSNNNWKKYGGIYKSDQLHNLSAGTLVADSLLLRQVNLTQANIDGALVVTGTAEITQTLSVGSTLTVKAQITAPDIILKNKLYLGVNEPRPYLYSNNNYIGINTGTPSAYLDVNGDTDNILRIRTSGANIKNIIAETTTGRGITSEINGLSSRIGFYNNNVLNSTNPISTITSESNNININSTSGIINISSKSTNLSSSNGNTIISTNTGNTNIITGLGGSLLIDSSGSNIIRSIEDNQLNSVLGNTIISSNKKLYIDSSGSNILNSGGSNILNSGGFTDISCTNVVMTGTGIHSKIMDEYLTVYDASNSTFLYDYYQNSNSKTGKAATFVANNNTSNTFINITAPNKMGLSLGGGIFSKDYNRSMGSIGITSNAGNYVPSQLMISGNSEVKYKTTTGFNTYSPKSEDYILDINGATRIGNGELTNVISTNSEILSMKFSKLNKLRGYAVGTPYTVSNPYNTRILYTSNGGQTWSSSSSFSNTSLFSNKNDLCVYPYDDNYAIFIDKGSGAYQYYTNNGGVNWYPIIFSFQQTEGIQLKTVYLTYKSTDSTFNVFIGETVGVSYKLLYYNINLIGSSGVNISTALPTITVSLSTINDSDGSGDFMFLVGNGIQKINISVSTPTATTATNTQYTYNSIYCFDNNYAVAVGNGIISYTTTASNSMPLWTNITTGVNTYNLRSVYIYDLLNGIVVGDNGVILYTINGSQTWQIVPSSLLNTSGVANLITNTTQNLRSIFMPDLNSFVIADVSSSYITNSSSGYSKIFYGYYPNLFNRANNNVLDVSGNMKITGDIIIDGSGQLRTLNQYFYLLNDTVQFITMGTTTSTITVGGNSTLVQIPGKLFVNGDASFNTRVIVGSDVSLGGRLFVQGTSVQNGDASFNRRVIVGSDISLGGRLFVQGTSVQTGDSSFNTRVIVGSDVSLGGRLFVQGTSVQTGDSSFNNRVIVGSDVSLGGRLFVLGDSTMNGNLLLKGNLIVQQAQNQNIINTTVNNYQLIIGEDLSLNGRLSTIGDVSIGGNLFVTKPIMSPCYDTSADTITLGSYGSTGKTINIRSYTYVMDSPSTINLGNYKDKINIQGNVTFANTENLLVKSKIIQLNAGNTIVTSSYGTGIQIQDGTNLSASYIITNGTSTDIRGYNFKATNSNNVLLLDVASMTLNSNKSGMVSLVKSTDLQSYLSDSSYALTVNNNIDCNWNGSNNFYISTKTYLNSDVSMNANVFIPKGNMVFGKQTQTQNTTTQAITGPFIDISGTVNQSGVIFQF